MGNTKPKKVSKKRYLGYPRLKGLMAQYKITVDKMSKIICRAPSTISLANNGYNLYDSMDMLNIQKFINKKAAEKANREGKPVKVYSVDEIFFS